MSKVSNVIDFLDAGLRAESLRQKAIARNVANLETPGYRSVDVKFEDLLANALNRDETVGLDEIKAEFFEQGNLPVKSNGNDVNLEAEIGKMVKNSLRHTTYIRLLNKKYQQMQQAMEIR